MSHVFDVFGVFRLLLDQLVPVFDVFGVFRLFPEKINHVFDVFTCLVIFLSTKCAMCLACLACLRVWDFLSPKNMACV